MTILHATSTFPSSLPAGTSRSKQGVARVLSLFEPLLTWEARIRQRRQLAEMDDRLLQDTGITRTEANFEAAKPFWRA